MKPFVWRGNSGRWWVDADGDTEAPYPGTARHGYATWGEAWNAALEALVPEAA